MIGEHGHFIKQCKCGNIVAQCRCISKGKKIVTVNSCSECSSQVKVAKHSLLINRLTYGINGRLRDELAFGDINRLPLSPAEHERIIVDKMNEVITKVNQLIEKLSEVEPEIK